MPPAPAGPAEISLELPGIRLAARVWGPADGAPVLALHGWLDNAASFDRLAPLLPGCRLVALDLPGHGRSAHRVHPTYYLLDYGVDVIAAADALGWRRFALLGHSLGAGVACIAAGTVPERISALGLIEGLGPLTDSAAEAPTRLRQAIDRLARGPREPRGRPDYPSIDAAAAARHRHTGLAPELARPLVARALVADGDGWSWATDPRLRWPSRVRLMEPQVLAFLAAITCEVRLVVGDRGFAFDPALAAARRAAVAGLRVIEVAGGHHVHLEDPAAVAAALGEGFFRSWVGS